MLLIYFYFAFKIKVHHSNVSFTPQTLEKEAKHLAEQATSGCFLDSNQNPLLVLRMMKEVGVIFICYILL